MESFANTLQQSITHKELRWLLVDIKDLGPDAKVKFRMVQDGWQSKYFAIAHVTESSVILIDQSNHQLKFISFQNVTQFATNKMLNNIPANHHFDVRPSPEVKAHRK
jgi:hypothetical protein